MPAFAVHLDGSYEGTLDIANPSHIQEISRVIREYDISLLVLDVLCEMHTMDENSASEMGAVLRGLRNLAHSSNCTILINHHMNKRNQSRGSNGIAAGVDIQIDYLADEDSSRLEGKLRVKGRGVPKIDLGIAFGNDSRWSKTSGESTPEAKRPTQETRILEALRQSDTPLTVPALSERTGIAERSLQTVISRLKRSSPGLLVESAKAVSGTPIQYLLGASIPAGPTASATM